MHINCPNFKFGRSGSVQHPVVRHTGLARQNHLHDAQELVGHQREIAGQGIVVRLSLIARYAERMLSVGVERRPTRCPRIVSVTAFKMREHARSDADRIVGIFLRVPPQTAAPLHPISQGG